MKHKYKPIIVLCVALLLAGCIVVHPTKAEEQHLDNGITYVEQGRYDAAISEFTKALETYPQYN
jgi:hypothetical protein